MKLSRIDKIMFSIIGALIAIFLIMFIVFNVSAEMKQVKTLATGTASTEAVQAYMHSFFKGYSKKKRNAALKFAPFIVELGNEWNINPLLITFVADRENSMRFRNPRRGKRGEIGVMQVMPHGACGRGQNLKTTEGNLRAGVRCLSLGLDMCGDNVYRILSSYKCGTCECSTPSSQSAIRSRTKKFDKILRDFSNL